MKRLLVVSLVVLTALVFFSTKAIATIISYEASYISGTTWEYSYTVSDHVFNTGDNFEIVYELGSYENITDISHGSDWNVTTLDPVNIPGWFSFNGIYNGTASANNSSLIDPFVVQFDWLGTQDPSTQTFNVYLAGSWIPDETGTTKPVGDTSIPEPSTILLIGSLLGFITINRKA